MTEEGMHLEGRYSHLDARVSHLDGRVNEMAQDMSSVRTSVEGLVVTVNKLAERVTEPVRPNWVGIGSLILALLVGGAGFVEMRVGPSESLLKEAIMVQRTIVETLADRSSVIAKAEVRLADDHEEIEKLWRDYAALKKEVSDLRVEVAGKQ